MDARQNSVLVQSEGANYGVDPGAWANTHGLVFRSFDCDVENQPGYSRAVQGLYGGRQRVNYLGGRHQSWSGVQEFRGKGQDLTALIKPPFHDLLVAAGMVATFGAPVAGAWNYAPAGVGVATSSAAIRRALGGLLYLLLGARSNVVIEAEARKPATISYQGGLARYSAPANAAYVEAAPADEIAPVTVGNVGYLPYAWNPTAAQFGFTRKFTLDLRFQIDPGDGLSLGSDGLAVVRSLGRGTVEDPGPVLDLEVEQPSGVANADAWIAAQIAQTIDAARTLTLGSAAGNTIVLNLARLHVAEVHPIRIGPKLGHKIRAYPMLSAGATGEDDITITAT